MKRWLMLLAVLAPNLSGCLAYAYPTVSHTPELTVPNADGSVHAFRVDIDRTERPPQPTTTQYTLSRIPLDERGLIPSQLEVAHATGTFNVMRVVDGAHEHSQYSLSVRVYRPGYHTVEVKQWSKVRDLQWSPATDLLAHEKAVDDLLEMYDPTHEKTWWEWKDAKGLGLGLMPGLESSSQKHALLFAAGEYQRLAGSPLASQPANQTVRERLQQKAIWLRRYAEQNP